MQPNSDDSFYLLTHSTFERLRDANLTAVELKLWMYLVVQKPNTELTISKVMEECQIGKSTYHKAKAKLKELGLLTIERISGIEIQLLR